MSIWKNFLFSCLSKTSTLGLIQKYDIIDFELGTKLTGAGFPVYKGKRCKIATPCTHQLSSSTKAEKQGLTR
jgi:hypothetical protein